jgi:nitrous oxidase accessory protein NosD
MGINMRKSMAMMLVLVLLTASSTAMLLPVKAVPKTIIVPDDYPTISSAVGNATDGDVIFVKKGTYEEKTLEINKTLSLIGEDINNTVIKLHPPVYNVTWILSQSYATLSNAITIYANDFMLSNLTIVLNPDGYIATTGDRTRIIGNNITGTGTVTGLIISGSYCNITDNTSSGLVAFDFATNTYITNTHAGGFISLSGSSNMIARNTFSKIFVSGNSNIISNNTISSVELSNANNNVVYGNNISTSTISTRTADYGVELVENSSHNIIYNNNILALLNDVEIRSKSAENNTFYHNNFLIKYSNEPARLYTYSLTLVNFWDNGEEGNYWEDYNGTDANRDGIGDAPYVIDADNVDRYPLMFLFDVENDTIVLPPPEPFPTILIAAVAGTAAVIAISLLVYFKKRNR